MTNQIQAYRVLGKQPSGTQIYTKSKIGQSAGLILAIVTWTVLLGSTFTLRSLNPTYF